MKATQKVVKHDEAKLEKMEKVAQGIRYLLSCGYNYSECSKIATEHFGKKVSYQWCYNVDHQMLKGKK